MWDDLREVVLDRRPLDQLLRAATPATAASLERALAKDELTAEEAEHLLSVEGADFAALVRAAETGRRIAGMLPVDLREPGIVGGATVRR